MADLNNPKNAAAPEILAALKALQADLAAARSQLAVLERQVGAARAAPVARAAGAAEGAARSEADMARLLQMEKEFVGLRETENVAAKTLADSERARGVSLAKNLAEEKAATAELARRAALQESLNVVTAQAARLPVGQRAGYVANQAQYAPILAGAQAQQVRRVTSNAFAADEATRIAATRQSVAALTVTEGQYIERTRTAGAMSGDFLSRLARGQTTVREFGANLGQTAGKFAGWTAAAAGVGIVVGAAVDLGKGARDSAGGVDQLARSIDNVSPEKAQAGFRQLSRETNLSIKDVADAQFQFARTFNTQEGSLQAARVGLRAYRLDNVNVADSVRALTAVHNQFGVQADGLLPLFNKLDEGQRKFNARVSESLPALTRSAAGVKNAGGDLNQLIDIIVYGVRVTGQSGNVLGNALSRSATNFVPKAKNAAELKKLGFDPTQAYTQLLTEAIHKAASLTGEQRRDLANALGGPQLGSRVFAPLLGGTPGQFAQVQKGLAHAGDSSGKEMEDLLNKVDEQLSKVGHSLERIGSALAQSGAFQGLGVALHVLNAMLGGVEKIVEVFDELPASIRPWISALIEARGIMFILQRTKIGAGLADSTGIGFLGPSPERRALKQQVGSLERSAGAYESSAATAAANARAAEQEALIQQRLAIDERQAGDLAAANRLEQEANASRERAVTQSKVAQALTAEANTQREAILGLERGQIAVSEEIVQAQRAAIAALAEGNATNAAAAAAAAASAGAGGLAGAAGASRAVGGAEGLAVVGQGRALTAAEQSAVAAATGGAAATEGRVASLATGARQVAAAGGRFGRGLFAWGNNLGLFSKALGAFIVGQIFFDQVRSDTEAIAKQSEELSAGVQNAQGIRDSLKRTHQGHALPFASRVYDLPLEGASTIAGAFRAPGSGYAGFESMQQTVDNQANAQASLDRALLRARRHTAPGTKAGKSLEVARSYQELLKQQSDNTDEFVKHAQTQDEFKQHYELLTRSAKASIDVLTGSGKGLKAALEQLRQQYVRGFQKAGPTAEDPFAQFDRGNLTDATNFLDKIGSRDKIRGTNESDFTTITRGITYISARYRGTNSKKKLQAIDQAYGALDTFLQQQADEFQDVLNRVKDFGSKIPAAQITPGLVQSELQGQGQRTDRAYDDYIQKLQNERAQLPKRIGELRKPLGKDNKALGSAQVKLVADEARLAASSIADKITGGGITIPGITGIGGLKPLDIQKLQHAVDQDQKRVKDLGDKVKGDKKGIAAAQAAIKKRDAKILAMINQAQEDQFSLDSEKIDLRSQYAQATATDKSGAIAEKIKFDGQQVQLAMKYHGPDRWAKITQALITQANDIQAQAQQHVQDVQLNAQVATSAITGTGPAADRARLQSELHGAQRVLAAARAEKPNPGKADDIKNAIIGVHNIEQQINQSVHDRTVQAHQDAAALRDSLTAIAVAKAGDDPVKRDRAQLKGDLGDLHALKRSDFQSTAAYQAARNQALAKVITDRHQIVTDTANVDLQNAQFEHQIGKLTDDQYISKLKDILKLKGLSKQMRQQLLLEIYQTEHANDSNLELNVGDIKLPSTYQIVRGLRSKLGAKAPAVSQTAGALLKTENHNTFTFIVNGSAKEMSQAIGEALDMATGGSALANLRAAGAI
jgi:hypothetical protein